MHYCAYIFLVTQPLSTNKSFMAAETDSLFVSLHILDYSIASIFQRRKTYWKANVIEETRTIVSIAKSCPSCPVGIFNMLYTSDDINILCILILQFFYHAIIIVRSRNFQLHNAFIRPYFSPVNILFVGHQCQKYFLTGNFLVSIQGA